jgi:hypothetical protein
LVTVARYLAVVGICLVVPTLLAVVAIRACR